MKKYKRSIDGEKKRLIRLQSPEIRKKISDALKGKDPINRRHLYTFTLNQRRSKKLKGIPRPQCGLKKEKHWNWKGGKTFKEYICIICKKKFIGKENHNRKTCSKNCMYKLIKSRPHKPLEHLRLLKRLSENKRRAQKKKCKINKFTIGDWKGLKQKFNYTCKACGEREPKIKLTIDHVIPLSKGGEHSIFNIQPLCLSCNCKKYNSLVPLVDES